MSHLVHRFFGDLSGKLGDVVFRIRGNKNYIAQASSGYTQPDTAEYRDKLSRFGLTSRFCSAVVRMKEIKGIWKELYQDVHLFNMLKSINWQYTEAEEVTEYAVISPITGFSAQPGSAELSALMLTVNMLPLTIESGINPAVEKLVNLSAVVVLSGPVDAGISKNHVFPLVSDSVLFNLTDPITFRVYLSDADADMLVHYGNRKVFCSLVTLDAGGVPVEASKTFCVEV